MGGYPAPVPSGATRTVVPMVASPAGVQTEPTPPLVLRSCGGGPENPRWSSPPRVPTYRVQR
jgi:hypothetical protein